MFGWDLVVPFAVREFTIEARAAGTVISQLARARHRLRGMLRTASDGQLSDARSE
jgi:hypothetical protein